MSVHRKRCDLRPHGHVDPLNESIAGTEYVYYVRRRGCIKIGYSSDLAMRKRKLGVEWSDFIGLEHGGRALERKRHEQFAHLRVEGNGLGVEHYLDCEELVEHARAVMEATQRIVAGVRAALDTPTE